MKFFKALDSDATFKRGDHRVCKTTISVDDKIKGTKKNVDMYAVCWKDKATKYFVGTCGSTTQGKPHVVERTRVTIEDGERKTMRCDKSTSCPTFVNELFEGFNAVDLHDRYRQDLLGIENHRETHHWAHRLFATMLGIIITDAYFMYRMDYISAVGSEDEMEPFEDWVGILASELIFNDEDDISTRSSDREHSCTVEDVSCWRFD